MQIAAMLPNIAIEAAFISFGKKFATKLLLLRRARLDIRNILAANLTCTAVNNGLGRKIQFEKVLLILEAEPHKARIVRLKLDAVALTQFATMWLLIRLRKSVGHVPRQGKIA